MHAEPTSPSPVLIENRGTSARVTINRPPLNVMDIPTLSALRSAVAAAERDAEVRLIEFTGAGEKAFSAGTDIHDHLPGRAPEMLRVFHDLIRAVLRSRCVSVAVVRGHCLGGGMELALACDFIVASDSAQFGQPEIKLGCFPPVAAVLLPRLISEKKALEMILTGECIGAEEAHRLGLVNRVTAAASLEDVAGEFEAAMTAHSPEVLSLARKAVRFGSRAAIEIELRECERIYLEELLRADDAREGIAAFIEKRAPKWRPNRKQRWQTLGHQEESKSN